MLGKTICWSPYSCSCVLAKWTEILKKLVTQVRLKMYLISVFLVRPNQQLTTHFILKGWQTFCQRRFNWPEFWLALIWVLNFLVCAWYERWDLLIKFWSFIIVICTFQLVDLVVIFKIFQVQKMLLSHQMICDGQM